MKKGMRFLAIFSFVIFAELLSVHGVLAADTAVSNSLSSRYYRIPAVTSDIASLTPSDSRLFAGDQMVLSTTDTISLFDLPQTDQRRFPNFDTLPGEPKYFSAHWSGSIIVSKDGDYRVTLSSHEASQLFINGKEIVAISPNDQLGGKSLMVHLSEGASNVDVYFAKRSDFQSGLVFKIDGVKFTSSYNETMPTANPMLQNAVVATPVVPANTVANPQSANSAPRVVYFNPPHTANPDKYFAYKVLGTDADNPSLSYKLIASPQGMTIAPATGLLLWKPTASQLSATPYQVVVAVSDGIDTATTQFEISVKIPVTNSALLRNEINSQVAGNSASEPARKVSEENISISDESKKETSTSAGGRLSASVLFTGAFTLGRWLASRWTSFVYFLVSMVLTGLVVYVFLEIVDRKKRNRYSDIPAFSADMMRKDPIASQIRNA